MKQLIINADDFGFTTDVNAGIVQAHTEGVLTATTLMANGEAFADAVRLALQVPTLDVGVHLVLIQGHALTTGQRFPETPREVVMGLLRGGFDVYAELRAQIQKVMDAGVRPSHLDTHKHTHIMPGVFRKVVRLAQEFEIPYVRLPLDHTTPGAKTLCSVLDPMYRRSAQKRRVRMTDHFLGFRLTGSLNEQNFLETLRALEPGTTEFMCHPGLLGEPLQRAATRLKQTRVEELKALTSIRVREVIAEEGVRLATFRSAAQDR